jgi:hypothetical protein
MGGGCEGCEEPLMQESMATEAAATEESFAAEMAPAATEAPPAESEPMPVGTAMISPTEGARVADPTPSLKEGADESSAQDSAPETATQPEVQPEPGVSLPNWTMLFLIIAIAGGAMLWFMRFSARNKWR